MINSDTALYALVYVVTRKHVREWGSSQWRYARRSYLKKRKRLGTHRHCDICHKVMADGEVSVDHIIPLSVAIAYDLPALEYHHSNFRLAHIECNSRRNVDAERFHRLDPKLKRKVLEWQRQGLYQTMGFIPITKKRVFEQVYFGRGIRVYREDDESYPPNRAELSTPTGLRTRVKVLKS